MLADFMCKINLYKSLDNVYGEMYCAGNMTTQSRILTEQEKSALLAQRFTSPGYINWRKVPSVTTGGKPHFWFRIAPSCLDGKPVRQSIVWDRLQCGWIFQTDRD